MRAGIPTERDATGRSQKLLNSLASLEVLDCVRPFDQKKSRSFSASSPRSLFQSRLDESNRNIVDAGLRMSKHLDLSLNDIADEEEEEEYFSNSSSHSSVPPRRPSSRQRAKNRPSEPKESKSSSYKNLGTDNGSSESAGQNLDELTWVDHDESTRPNTPLSAYLNAFFMTIATVLVRHWCLLFGLYCFVLFPCPLFSLQTAQAGLDPSEHAH